MANKQPLINFTLALNFACRPNDLRARMAALFYEVIDGGALSSKKVPWYGLSNEVASRFNSLTTLQAEAIINMDLVRPLSLRYTDEQCIAILAEAYGNVVIDVGRLLEGGDLCYMSDFVLAIRLAKPKDGFAFIPKFLEDTLALSMELLDATDAARAKAQHKRERSQLADATALLKRHGFEVKKLPAKAK